MRTTDCVLALDFDGVVCDSIQEAFFISCLTWERLFGPLPPGLEPGFRAGRWLSRTAPDFYLLLRLLIEDKNRDFVHWPKDDFKARLAEESEAAYRFDAMFYATRDEERSSRSQHWLSLQSPYPHFVEVFPQLRQAFRDIVIATTKDEASVQFLLESAGIHLNILGKAFSRDKADQVRHLAAARQVPIESIVLIDDLLDNLRPVRAVGAKVALATWGYNTETERNQALQEGITLVRPGTVLADLEVALSV